MSDLVSGGKQDFMAFQFDDHAVQVQVDAQGNPWWIAAEVCAALGLSNPSEVANRLKAEESTIIIFSENGVPHRLLLINEQGLYRLIFRSNKATAEKFQDWVFRDVLPSIRKTGGYVLGGSLTALATQQLEVVTYLEAKQKLDSIFGLPLHLTLTEGVKEIRQLTGLDLSQKLLTSPHMDNLEEEAVFLEVADICARHKLPKHVLNPLLAKAGYQVKLGHSGWEPTSMAHEHGLCSRHAWTRQGKSGINWKWQVTFAEDLLQQAGLIALQETHT